MSSKVAIVTGASQGIGRSTAIRLARDFDSIVLVARNRANLEETGIEVKTAGAETLVIDVDLSQPEAARQVVDQTLACALRMQWTLPPV
ncbi:SDR family NAD(P)-dependent oxidoreductase [Paraburkholderia sp. SIMBA_030]|uniref:SDR family NAD(P)-dependent oxidoreductase n=1 Tax=Paraburkholderia sp. SIMBA_030 TaxID=3085773 RepID=UPI00397AE57F